MAEDFRTTLSVQNSGCPTESDQLNAENPGNVALAK
jgi:hypothetical protein